MRRLGIILITVLILTFLGYSAFWYIQAQKLRQQVESIITQYVTASKEQSTSYTIKYEKIAVAGYPTRFEVVIKKPMLHWQTETESGIRPFRNQSNVLPRDTITSDGEIVFSTHIFRPAFGLYVRGHFSGHTEAEPGSYLQWQFVAEGLSGCRIVLDRKGWATYQTSPVFQQHGLPMVLRTVQALDCESGGIAMHRLPERTVLYSAPKPELHFVVQSKVRNQADMKFMLQAKQVVTTKAFAGLVQRLGALLLPDARFPALQIDERAGKTDIDLAFTLSGPFLATGPLPDTYPFLLDAERFLIRNDWYTIDLPLYAAGEVRPGGGTLDLTTRSRFHFSKEAEETLRQDYQISGFAYAQIKQAFEAAGKLPKNTDPKQFDPSAVLPRLSDFGEITVAIDYTRKDAAFTLKTLNVQTALYHLKAEGAREANGNGELRLECSQCVHMVQDGLDYYNRVQRFFRQLRPDQPHPELSKEQKKAALALLRRLDSDPATPQLVTILVKETNGAVTIGQNSLPELIAELLLIFSAPLPAHSEQPQTLLGTT